VSHRDTSCHARNRHDECAARFHCLRTLHSMLQRVAACCRVIQCVAVCFSALQCAAVGCKVLRFILSLHKHPRTDRHTHRSRHCLWTLSTCVYVYACYIYTHTNTLTYAHTRTKSRVHAHTHAYLSHAHAHAHALSLFFGHTLSVSRTLKNLCPTCINTKNLCHKYRQTHVFIHVGHRFFIRDKHTYIYICINS